jgi:hypothetical protein
MMTSQIRFYSIVPGRKLLIIKPFSIKKYITGKVSQSQPRGDFLSHEGIYNAVQSTKETRRKSRFPAYSMQKFWEVQEPFFKMVLGRRGHK